PTHRPRRLCVGSLLRAGGFRDRERRRRANVRPAPVAGPRSRTIFVNDLSGDIDGLFAAAHQILSTSTKLRAIVGAGTGRVGETAERSAALAGEMLELMGKT